VTATVDEEGGFEFVRHESKLMVENGGQKVYRYDWERGETRDDREDKDDEGRRRLFSIALPSLMSREEEIDRMLDQQYRSKLKVRLVPTFLARVGKKDDTERTRQLLAEGLINGIFNTILPYFARYYTSLKATLSEKERERLRQNALQQMLKDQARIAFAHNDLILVFDELRKLVDEG
jgi:hypothetical protein